MSFLLAPSGIFTSGGYNFKQLPMIVLDTYPGDIIILKAQILNHAK